jgi:hypothetical protein
MIVARMNAIRLLGLMAMFGSAFAQSTTTSYSAGNNSTRTTTSSATAAVKTLIIQAGLVCSYVQSAGGLCNEKMAADTIAQDGLTYSPTSVVANVGDIIGTGSIETSTVDLLLTDFRIRLPSRKSLGCSSGI